MEGGLGVDDLITIIGEQAISIRLLRQEKAELQKALLEAQAERGGENAEENGN